nr:hypothetical protein [Acidicapsa ligni]
MGEDVAGKDRTINEDSTIFPTAGSCYDGKKRFNRPGLEMFGYDFLVA